MRTHYLTRRTPRVTPILSRLVTKGDDLRTLRRITGKSSLVNYAYETIGNTHRQTKTKDHYKEGQKQKKQRECLEVMNLLLVRDAAHHTKNQMTALLPPIVMMGGWRYPIPYCTISWWYTVHIIFHKVVRKLSQIVQVAHLRV
jgi:hypothetical protein